MRTPSFGGLCLTSFAVALAATTEATHVATNEPFGGFTLGAGLVAALAAGYYLRYFR